MLVDFRKNEARDFHADLCIIGAGAAGITLARAFLGTSTRLCLLESGGLEYDDDVQELYEGKNIGRPYFELDATRLRYFGGSTNHWAGRSTPLDELDFQHRPWVPHSGWPLTRADLDPYYKKAQPICNLGPYVYDERVWQSLDVKAPYPFDPAKLRVQFWQFSKPVARFGEAFHDALAQADNITVVLHANVTNIGINQAGSKVERLDIASLAGQTGVVRARYFVLACGGLENPRLLLVSNSVERAGVANRHDLVGRFFMEHPKGRAGDIVALDPYRLLDIYRKHFPPDSAPYWAAFHPGAALQRDKAILNSSLALYYDPEPGSGAAALLEIRNAHRRGREIHDWGSKIWRVLKDLDVIAAGLYRRQIEGKAPIASPGVLYFRARGEQAPNPQSRVTLTGERDALGLNRIALDWRLSDIDKRSIAVLTRTLGEEFGRLGLGRIRLADWLAGDAAWPDDLVGGNHHMGTTRMADDPKQGVVNADGRVHENDNLYIAGSSVFPTGGWAPPTLTIVALALRLADHLKARLAQGALA
jgi:choline dehydrogenase-like flavoprotein